MSPVQQSKARSPRSMVLGVLGIVVGVVLVLVLFVVAIPSLTEDGTVEVNLGDDTFAAGSAERLSEAIAEEGPLLFADVSGRNERDIIVQHLGDDPATGWFVFSAQRPGQDRDCVLDWQPDAQEFLDPCDGTVVPADGAGQIQYEVTVTEDGDLVVDLNPEDDTSGTPAG